MKERRSFRKRAKFSQRILPSRWIIFKSAMPNEHPGNNTGYCNNIRKEYEINVAVVYSD